MNFIEFRNFRENDYSNNFNSYTEDSKGINPENERVLENLRSWKLIFRKSRLLSNQDNQKGRTSKLWNNRAKTGQGRRSQGGDESAVRCRTRPIPGRQGCTATGQRTTSCGESREGQNCGTTETTGWKGRGWGGGRGRKGKSQPT